MEADDRIFIRSSDDPEQTPNREPAMTHHQERYDNWAPNYNDDVAARCYQAPRTLVAQLMDLIAKGRLPIDPNDPDLKAIDLGCGSGLVGQNLRAQGFRHIDGVDLSLGMLQQAYDSGAYRTLIPWQDLNDPLPFFLHGQYDLTICCGVFALDFVEPKSLRLLAQVTKPGGTLMLTTKTHYHRDYDFDSFCEGLIATGELTLVDCRRDQPYLGDEADGHYWVFRVSSAVEAA
jgi:predicted TPR repeat methyltransferase